MRRGGNRVSDADSMVFKTLYNNTVTEEDDGCSFGLGRRPADETLYIGTCRQPFLNLHF